MLTIADKVVARAPGGKLGFRKKDDRLVCERDGYRYTIQIAHGMASLYIDKIDGGTATGVLESHDHKLRTAPLLIVAEAYRGWMESHQ